MSQQEETESWPSHNGKNPHEHLWEKTKEHKVVTCIDWHGHVQSGKKEWNTNKPVSFEGQQKVCSSPHSNCWKL